MYTFRNKLCYDCAANGRHKPQQELEQDIIAICSFSLHTIKYLKAFGLETLK